MKDIRFVVLITSNIYFTKMFICVGSNVLFNLVLPFTTSSQLFSFHGLFPLSKSLHPSGSAFFSSKKTFSLHVSKF